MDGRRLQLLQEVREGRNCLVGGDSDDDQAAAAAKLREWQRLAEHQDVTLEVVYTITPRGPRLHHASAVLTPSGQQVLQRARRRTPV